MSQIVRSAVTATAILLVAGCATAANPTTTSGDGASGASYGPSANLSGSLSVMGFGAGDEIATTRLDLAKAALPGVNVSLIEGDLDIQAFLSAVASGKPPEIVYANRDQIGTFASRGAIMPLTDCISGEGIDTSQYLKPAVDQVTFNGAVYGIPEFNTVQLTMANKGLLDAAGLTIADVNGSDWAKISAANTAMAKSDSGKISVIGYDSKLPEFLPLWAKSNGADLLSADGRHAQLNDPKVVEALTWANSIYDDQGGFPAVKAYRDAADFFGSGNQFATDVLGAMPMEQWYMNVLNEVSATASLQFDSFYGTDGEPLAYASGSAWAIPKGSANPAAACRFAKTMTAVDSWMKAADARVQDRTASGLLFTGLLTGNRVADDKIKETYVKPSGQATWDEGVDALYTSNEHTFTLPANPADAEFKTAWSDAVNRVLNGQQDPQAALDQAQQEAQSALDAAWADWDKQPK